MTKPRANPLATEAEAHCNHRHDNCHRYVANSQVVPPQHFGVGGRTAADGEGYGWQFPRQTQHKHRGGLHTVRQVMFF